MPLLFPFGEYWWLYAAFTAGVLVILAIDLGVFHRDAHEVRFREAVAWSAVWVTLALLFNAGLYAYATWAFGRDPRLAGLVGFDPEDAAWQVALEFLTGYLVEYSLSVDNIFVFILVLSYFRVPARYQHRVLFYGIVGALIFRAVFIGLGSVLMRLHWVVWLFGVFLIFTGIKMLVASHDTADPERNLLVRLVRRVLPVTGEFHGQRFFIRLGGRLAATPLLVALLCLEASDIVFAIDSVPAIYGLTREPLIVFTSNVFAILGLRSMYFMLGGAVERFHLLRFGLAGVLIFVGLKMTWLDAWYGGKFPTSVSLAIIGSVILASVVASLILPRRPQAVAARAHSEEA
jgi:tellurite resistance protein TerC